VFSRKPRAPTPAAVEVVLAEDAHENGLATMLAELLRQNLAAKPHKVGDFSALQGNVAIVADDADVALTLCFVRRPGGGRLTIRDGIVGVPDVTIRGPSEAIMALSNLPLSLGLPIPNPRDPTAMANVRAVTGAMSSGRLHAYGMALHVPMMLKLTRVMSVHG
jgi:hypothetical protein